MSKWPATPLGHSILRAAAAPAVKVAIYNCLTCPFSARGFRVLDQEVIPMIEKEFRNKVDLDLFILPQPWHPQAGALAECAVAVELLKPAAMRAFYRLVFASRDELVTDEATWNRSRQQVYESVADAVCGPLEIERAAFLDLLKPVASGGVGATKRLKFYVKHHRAAGIHGTPTVQVNGLTDDTISSGWTVEQWRAYLMERISAAEAAAGGKQEAAAAGGQ